jgi:hypothetical protein
MPIARIASSQAGGAGTGAALSGAATLNTTTATLITAFLAYYNASGAPVFSSTPSGSWTAVRAVVNGSQNVSAIMYYLWGSGITANSYTFDNSTADFSWLGVASYSGTLTSGDPLDTSVAATDPLDTSQVSSLAIGPLTPGQADSLIVSGIALRGFNSKNKPTGITALTGILQQTDASATGLEGGGIADEIQVGAAAARTPTWGTFNSTDFCAAIMASFKPSAGGGGVTAAQESGIFSQQASSGIIGQVWAAAAIKTELLRRRRRDAWVRQQQGRTYGRFAQR